jgi:tetratricopeptide (TPR) repeat protein
LRTPDREYVRKSLFGRVSDAVKKLLVGLLKLPLLLLTSPFMLWGKLSRRQLMFATPAAVIICFLGFIGYRVTIQKAQLINSYRTSAIRAFDSGDYQSAKTYYQRLRSYGELVDASSRFQWAVILINSGDADRGITIIEELAPNDRIGHAPAHRLRALNLGQKLREKAEEADILEKLKWHLEHSRDDDSPEIARVRASYYLLTEQYDQAIKALSKSAETNPSHFLLIASVYESQGRMSDQRKTLELAARQCQALLREKPLDRNYRMSLARIHTKLEQFDEAEKVLLQGLRIQPDEVIRRSVADFYVMRHDQLRTDNGTIQQQLAMLDKAIVNDPNHPPVYERLIKLYQFDTNNANVIKQKFLDAVASDNPTAMAHFALSNIYWIEQDFERAEFHVERAYSMDARIVVVVNNLAWVIATQDEPDLDRALKLAQTAVQQRPGDGRFRDTLATVLIKLERWEEAIDELQLALKGNATKPLVHKKLAMAYGKLGMADLAQAHSEKGDDH